MTPPPTFQPRLPLACVGQVYVAGEYGWTSGDVSGFLSAAQGSPFVAGTQFWSLFPHLDTHGFEQHGDGFTVRHTVCPPCCERGCVGAAV